MPLVRATPVSPIVHRSGLYYGPSPSGANSTRTLSNQRNWYVPLWIPRTATYDRIGVEGTTAGTTANLRLAVYGDDGAGRPGTLIVDGGAVVCSVADLALTINQSIKGGLVWLYINQTGASVDGAVRAGSVFNLPYVGGSTPANAAQGNLYGWTTSAGNGDPAGAPPGTANLTGLSANATMPYVAIRAA